MLSSSENLPIYGLRSDHLDSPEAERLLSAMVQVAKGLQSESKVDVIDDSQLRTLFEALLDEREGPIGILLGQALAFEVSVNALIGENARLNKLLQNDDT